MRYSFQMNDKNAEIQCSDDLTIEEIQVVKEMLIKMCNARMKELNVQLANKLPLSAEIGSMYPELSVRTRNILLRSGCKTIEDVLNCTLTDIQKMRNMGKSSFEEIKERFSVYGHFKGEADK